MPFVCEKVAAKSGRLRSSSLASASDDGFGLGVGLRGAASTNLEWEAGINYVDLSDSNTSLELAGRYYFNENAAAGLGIGIDDDATSLTLGVRWEFDQR